MQKKLNRLGSIHSRIPACPPSYNFIHSRIPSFPPKQKFNPELHLCVRKKGQQGLCELLTWCWTAWQPAQQFCTLRHRFWTVHQNTRVTRNTPKAHFCEHCFLVFFSYYFLVIFSEACKSEKGALTPSF
jgi:hypothetical protein